MLVQQVASPVLVNYECDKCGKSNYQPTGVCYPSNPPQYPHNCSECGDTKIFRIQFPSLQYVPSGSKLDLKDFLRKVLS